MRVAAARTSGSRVENIAPWIIAATRSLGCTGPSPSRGSGGRAGCRVTVERQAPYDHAPERAVSPAVVASAQPLAFESELPRIGASSAGCAGTPRPRARRIPGRLPSRWRPRQSSTDAAAAPRLGDTQTDLRRVAFRADCGQVANDLTRRDRDEHAASTARPGGVAATADVHACQSVAQLRRTAPPRLPARKGQPSPRRPRLSPRAQRDRAGISCRWASSRTYPHPALTADASSHRVRPAGPARPGAARAAPRPV